MSARTACCQPAAGGLKFLFKEDPTPAGVDRFVYYLAPLLALALALTSIAIIPFGPDPLPWKIFGQDVYLGILPPSVNIGILALFAITALSVYGVALAGWSSNSKYPLLGGLRSSAQMVSYELALTLSVVGVLLLAGTFNLTEIIANAQQSKYGILGWNILATNSSVSFVSSPPRSPKPIACPSIFPKQNQNWSLASTRNTPASNSPCFSLLNTPA